MQEKISIQVPTSFYTTSACDLLLQAFVQRHFQWKVSFEICFCRAAGSHQQKSSTQIFKGTLSRYGLGFSLFGYVGSELDLNKVRAAADFKSIRASSDFTLTINVPLFKKLRDFFDP